MDNIKPRAAGSTALSSSEYVMTHSILQKNPNAISFSFNI
jgi:hypothetical protein